MIRPILAATTTLMLASAAANAADNAEAVSDDVVAAQRAALAESAKGQGYGPQSPRDLSTTDGANDRVFATAPEAADMALCDIHFHRNAEHKGGEFTTYAGNGDGAGHDTGYVYDGELTEAELAPREGGAEDLAPGDTIEIHFVHSTARATLGNGLGTCLTEATKNPQLRVETVVAVLVNDSEAADFAEMAAVEADGGTNQAPNLPGDLGTPVVYAGSTTGPTYNQTPSPFQVTWSVRPKVVKVDIATVDAWLADNPFDETGAHLVRNLVTNPDLLAPID